MSRYIDADKLISHIKDEIKGCATPVGGRANGKTLAYGTELGLKMALCFAVTLPTADVVEVRHGEWKYNEGGGYVCSECNCWLEDYYGATPEMMKYCFKCGAKMDGERREE